LTQSRDARVKTAKNSRTTRYKATRSYKDSEQAPATKDSKYVYGDVDVISSEAITQMSTSAEKNIVARFVSAGETFNSAPRLRQHHHFAYPRSKA